MLRLEGLQELRLPDPWQMQAVASLLNGKSVVVTAPTGAGKTFIFEKYWETVKNSKKAFYTVPTRALANDKWREWKEAGIEAGLLTGDVAISVDSPLVVATLESAWGAARGGVQADFWVLDEFHMLGESRRGIHYEAAVLMCPKKTQFLFLSGCVSNPDSVASWMRSLGHDVEVIQHKKRPVPIEEIDAHELMLKVPEKAGGWLERVLCGAIIGDMAPVLIFAPHRKEAERIAAKIATIPCASTLRLSKEQEAVCSPLLRKLLTQRVAYHHSGMGYFERAGVVEALAKAGQLRFVVATLGLGAGVNFSLRSVMLTKSSFQTDQGEREILPWDFLQMVGRAGRRGLDEVGFYIAGSNVPTFRYGKELYLKRPSTIPWSLILENARSGKSVFESAQEYKTRAFDARELRLGVESLGQHEEASLPCGLGTETARARLVRRHQAPFPGCSGCHAKKNCESFSVQPSPLWWMNKIGLLTRNLELRDRGKIFSYFSGAEGLAVAAWAEAESYPADEAVYHFANLFAGGRFHGENPRWSGRLARECQHIFGSVNIAGYLENGVPEGYGAGADEIVERRIYGFKSRSNSDAQSWSKGDSDRLMTEWGSFLRQLTKIPEADGIDVLLPLRRAAESVLGYFPDTKAQLNLPPLTSEQRQGTTHFMKFHW